MNKRVKNTLLCGLLFLWLAGALLMAQTKKEYSQSTLWWQVELTLTVSGEYSDIRENNGFGGKYSFTASILGTLEEDEEEDYIFFQIYQDIKNLQWTETLHNGSVQETVDLKKKVILEPSVYYVYNDHGKLSIDFGFLQPVEVPFPNPWLKTSLHKLNLPESAGETTLNTKEEYMKGIRTGSNQVVLEKKKIYKNPVCHRTYSWTWQEQNDSWKNSHQSQVTLKILRKERKDSKQ